MRNRIIITIVAILLTALAGLGLARRAHRELPLGKELDSGWGDIYWVQSASDGIRPVTVIGFAKDGHRKNFIFCGRQEQWFTDPEVKHQMFFRWNPNTNCDQLTEVNRTLAKGWDTVWFPIYEGDYQ